MRKCVRRFTTGAAIAGMALVSQAQAVVIDFESISPRLLFGGDSASQAGFTLTQGGDFGTVDTSAGCFSVQCPGGSSGQFYAGLNDTNLTVSYGGLGFSLQGFSTGFIAPLGGLGNNVTAGRIQLYVTFIDDTTAIFSRDLAPSAANGQFPFAPVVAAPALQVAGALKSVQFSACTYVGAACFGRNDNLSQFALDNIAVTPVPEPAPLALLAAGLAVLALRRRAAR